MEFFSRMEQFLFYYSGASADSVFHKITRLSKSTGFLLQINRVLAGFFLDKKPLI